jgi:cytidylate kinase
MIIAIDGPAGSGKSSTARRVARDLGFLHLDTGAMYRAITLKCLRLGILHTDNDSLQKCVEDTIIRFAGSFPDVRVTLDGADVTEEIRGEQVTGLVSDYCAPSVVRQALVEQQRQIASGRDVVCEGRDIGTVVFPNADLKFFMVASVEERARRRQRDFKNLGIEKTIDELAREIAERDHKDSTRQNSPLCKASDAIEIDTTNLSFEQQVELIVQRVRNTVQPVRNT